MPAGRLLLAALLLALAPAQDTRAAKTMGEGAEAVEEQAAATASKPAAGWRNMAAAATNTKSQPLWQRWEELYPSSKLSPVMGALKDHEYVYQIPASPTATLFVSPGCAHAATDWWPASPVCPSCLGLPEEVAQTQQALARGYAGETREAGRRAGRAGHVRPARPSLGTVHPVWSSSHGQLASTAAHPLSTQAHAAVPRCLCSPGHDVHQRHRLHGLAGQPPGSGGHNEKLPKGAWVRQHSVTRAAAGGPRAANGLPAELKIL